MVEKPLGQAWGLAPLDKLVSSIMAILCMLATRWGHFLLKGAKDGAGHD
jgi:hypothetical protein